MSKYTQSTVADVAAAAQAAHEAFQSFSSSNADTRSQLLRGLAQKLEDNREQLVTLADNETHLGAARLNGELDRTAFQLRGFATKVEQGAAFVFEDDPAVSGPPPVGHPHLVRVRIPVGPVAMFSASNFPFAFSVLGGDTASALAAGCSVVVKAHSGHQGLSHTVAALAREVIQEQGLPLGLLSLVDGPGSEIGVALVEHPLIKAAAFTGSVRGGLALASAASARKQPIPFYGELGSINPVIALPSALAAKGAELAQGLAASITMGTGQFCTSPGIVLVPVGEAGDAFVEQLANALRGAKTHEMLTPQMRKGFDQGRAQWATQPKLQALVTDTEQEGEVSPRPYLAQIGAADFLASHQLHEEVFGPAAIIVRVSGPTQVLEVLGAVGGSLTVTIWGADAPSIDNVALVRAASSIAGRVLFTGFPTGVAVTAGQHHGGPFPASTAPFTTSVGYAALDRFLRPVALQDAPQWLLDRQGVPA
ncbi:aldehyde dehydrogenase [Comamonas thiooxydans]|uniref:Aldehyde dehydrogenase n=1 Tax=Comamonas thiooxydans TaxID=363952 RepID=A0A0E3BQL6_9BURK|nr:aldehyde dehydrogenase (NADP(+)) [Comamonas thiooxydans]KGH08233.1 aldehyde dehydrogenase [Comamonas thiooxydans]KGH12763.1 aldehyde dehydrogenase [Comamonas thiooxydans]